MQTKIASALVALLCVCTVVNSAALQGYNSVECRKTVIDGITEEECDDGTGRSTERGEPDNILLGFDSKGRRVMRVAGDDDTCYIYPNKSIALPDKVQKMTIDEKMYPADVTDPEVLESVKEWCGDNVVLLTEDASAETAIGAGGRHKRAVYRCTYYYRCVWYRIGTRIYYYCRLYRWCRRI